MLFLFQECIFRFHVSYFGDSIPISTCNILDFLTATPFWKRSKKLHPGVFKFCFSGWISKAFLRGSCGKLAPRNRWTWSHHHWRTNLKIMICVCFFKLRVAPTNSFLEKVVNLMKRLHVQEMAQFLTKKNIHKTFLPYAQHHLLPIITPNNF